MNDRRGRLALAILAVAARLVPRAAEVTAGLVALASAWSVWLPARRAARADPAEVLRAE